MVELEDDGQADAPWQPVGLAAAAQAAHTDGTADPVPPAGEGAAPGRPPLSWERLIALVLDVVFARLEARDPLWKLEPGERDALAGAWDEYLQTVAMAPGPLAGALLATGVVVGPRIVDDARKRRAERTLDVDAEVRDQGPS